MSEGILCFCQCAFSLFSLSLISSTAEEALRRKHICRSGPTLNW